MVIKYYQIWFGDEIDQQYADCMAPSKALIESSGHEYELIQKKFSGSVSQKATEKDKLAFDLLAGQPCAVFDCDLTINEIFIPDGNAAIFEWGTPRIGYMISIDTQFFKDLLEEKKRKGITEPFGYPNKLLRDKGKNLIEIPKSTFYHHRFTTGRRDYF